MLILSQDKQALVPVDIICLEVVEDTIGFRTSYNGGFVEMAAYETVERCEEVMKEIIDEYRRYLYTEGGTDYSVPGVVQAFGFVPPKVFEMPEE